PEPLFREFVGAATTHAGEEPADGGEIAAPDGDPEADRMDIGLSRSSERHACATAAWRFRRAAPPGPLACRPVGNERLYDTFVRLCEIRSPTGEGREGAETLAAELRAGGPEGGGDDG